MREIYRSGSERIWIVAFAIAFILAGYVARIFPARPDEASLYWALELAAVAVPAVVLLLLARFGILKPSSYYFWLPTDFRWFAVQAAICFVAFYVVIFSARDLIWEFVWPYEFLKIHQREVGRSGDGTDGPVLWFVLVLVIGAFLEEIVYRAMLFHALDKSLAYLLVSPVLFAGIHVNQGLFGMVQAGLMGAVACVLFLWTKSVIPLALAHLGVNLCVLWVRFQ